MLLTIFVLGALCGFALTWLAASITIARRLEKFPSSLELHARTFPTRTPPGGEGDATPADVDAGELMREYVRSKQVPKPYLGRVWGVWAASNDPHYPPPRPPRKCTLCAKLRGLMRGSKPVSRAT